MILIYHRPLYFVYQSGGDVGTILNLPPKGENERLDPLDVHAFQVIRMGEDLASRSASS